VPGLLRRADHHGGLENLPSGPAQPAQETEVKAGPGDTGKLCPASAPRLLLWELPGPLRGHLWGRWLFLVGSML
jgi:hypothetical protein